MGYGQERRVRYALTSFLCLSPCISLLFAVFLQHCMDKVIISTSKFATRHFLPGKRQFFLAVVTKDLGLLDCLGFLSVIVRSLPYKNWDFKK